MKKLGEGWQYTVYDLGNGRVLKNYNSRLRTCWIILKDIIPGELSGLFRIPDYIPDLRRKAQKSFEILERRRLPADWVAHPLLLPNLAYEQDKVTPLLEIFERSSLEEGKQIIDLFIVFTHRLIEHGVIDKFFNITKNFGQDRFGNIVLIDLGELEDVPAKILKHRRERVWAVPYKLKWIRHKELRRYFVEQMDFHFSTPSSS